MSCIWWESVHSQNIWRKKHMLADLRCRVISGVHREASGEADGISCPINPPRAHRSWKRWAHVPDIPVKHTCPRKFPFAITGGIILKFGETRRKNHWKPYSKLAEMEVHYKSPQQVAKLLISPLWAPTPILHHLIALFNVFRSTRLDCPWKDTVFCLWYFMDQS